MGLGSVGHAGVTLHRSEMWEVSGGRERSCRDGVALSRFCTEGRTPLSLPVLQQLDGGMTNNLPERRNAEGGAGREEK